MQSPSARSKAFILRPSGGLKKTERFSSPVGRGLARKGRRFRRHQEVRCIYEGGVW